MKFLTLLLLLPLSMHAQRFEASAQLGGALCSTQQYDGEAPFKNSIQPKSMQSVAFSIKAGMESQNWQANIRIGTQQIYVKTTETFEIKNIYGRDPITSTQQVKYAFARPLISYTVEVNRLINTKLGRFTAGGALGFATSHTNASSVLYVTDEEGYKTPVVFSTPSSKGLNAGMQIGYTHFATEHVGISLNAGAHYYNGKTKQLPSGTTAPPSTHTVSFLYYPFLIGVTYRL